MNHTKDYEQFPPEARQIAKSIAELVRGNRIQEAEEALAEKALEVCCQVASNQLSPQQADRIFTAIDLYLDSNCGEVNFSDEFGDLLFEGMLLHDYGTPYGADPAYIQRLAETILKRR